MYSRLASWESLITPSRPKRGEQREESSFAVFLNVMNVDTDTS